MTKQNIESPLKEASTVQIRVTNDAYTHAVKLNGQKKLKSGKPESLQETVSSLILNTKIK